MVNERVSVIVPVYNVERYLNRCISSIVNQTYRNLEIILVDDGSTDNCPQMCDDWARGDCRIKVIHKVNEGAGIARNTGLFRARGEYVCFFDSDDFVEPDAIEKALGLAQKECADVVVFGASNWSQTGFCSNKVIPLTEKTVFSGSEIQDVFLPDLIESNYVGARNTGLALSFWVCLFSMELIRRADWQIASERVYASEDSYSLLMLYRFVKKVAILPEALYHYQLNDESLSHTYREDGFARMSQFFQDCIYLATRLEYSEKVRKRLAGLYFSQVIGILKQIVAVDMDSARKKILIQKIVTDDLLQYALAQIDWRYTSKAKQFLLEQIRKKRHRLVHYLLVFQLWRMKYRK